MSLNRHTIDTQFTYIIYIIYIKKTNKNNRSIDSRACSKNWLKMYKNKVVVCGGLYTVGAWRKCEGKYCTQVRFPFSSFLERAEAVIRCGTKCCFSHRGGEVQDSPMLVWGRAGSQQSDDGVCTVPGWDRWSCRAVACRCMAVSYQGAEASWNREAGESTLLVPTSPRPHRAHPPRGFLRGQTRLTSLWNLRELGEASVGSGPCSKWFQD